ncbi:hypothetical protein JDV02_003780 [Purpureocillium takamizusanense]|uniref:37S ribosomal protein MRP4 n=1 Tax=Purpureocillium takamizusanense TaxID=2060973 RepID=A0A9Q8QEV0_9HYPO|nr:uncharacterized protein JDV02_003780 [Purpureocillium takamizusanense]UNI17437.1 hypothetical protein JDV02_003780 [Purpureocillium takamizusanense]
MIIGSVAVRHGRRALTPTVTRCALRQLSTDVKTDNSATPAALAWSMPQSTADQPKPLRSSKKKKQRAVQEVIMSLGADSSREHREAAWTTPHQIGSELMTPAQQFAEFQRIQKNTRSLGSQIERRYAPTQLMSNPPAPEDVTLELLMASQTHMGHNTSLWNPANSRYIYGVRQGIHIISLETTAAHLRRAARVVEEVAYRGGVILFVGTRKGQMEIVTKAAAMAGACHLFTKWTPGAITNRDVILASHSTKVVDHLDGELDGFDMYMATARPLLPDLVVCLNPLENYTLLYECGLKNIPTIGVIDTNADPSWVTYTIPANDDSLRSMAVVAGVLGRAGEKGQKRRQADAAQGSVSWHTPPELSRHMMREARAAVQKQKEVMGRLQSGIQGFTEEEQNILRSQYGAVELEVSEDDMVQMMGKAVDATPAEPETDLGLDPIEHELEDEIAQMMGEIDAVEDAAPADTELDMGLDQIERELEGVRLKTADIETAVKGDEE